jgi:hypothetical protein
MGRFTQNGVVYEELPDGQVRVVAHEQQAQQPQVSSFPLPTSPRQQAADSRDNAASSRDDTRTGIAVRGESRDVASKAFDHARDLRTEFSKLPDVQDYRAAIKAYSTALKTFETPAGDLNLIYAFAKIMDPNSVVREGEQAAVAGGDSMSGQIIARLKKEVDGSGTFRPEYRNQLRRELQNRVSELNSAYEGQRQQYEGFAGQLGVDPRVVVGTHDGQMFHGEILDYWKRQGVEVLPSAMDAAGNVLPNGARAEQGVTMMPKTPGGGGSYRGSMLGQGISGINEGLANTIGAPVDLATAAMNLVPRGINAAANTSIPTIERPAMGSEWLKDRMKGWGIYDQTSDSGQQFLRRVGQSVGGAAVPVMGAGGSMINKLGGLAAAAGGGVGGAAAQRAFPGNPVAEFAGETLGGGLTAGGLLGAARRGAQRQIEAAVPTVDQLKEQAGKLYQQAESRGVTASPEMTQELGDSLRDLLQSEGRVSPKGRISEVYPKVKEAMQLAEDYRGQMMNPTQIQTMRKVMADGLTSAESSERRTASMMTDTFDNWANPQAPELAQARGISNRYLNAQKLEQARELARSGRFSGSGFENALRTEYRGLDRQSIKGGGRYTDALTNAIQGVSRGTPMSNAARGLGKLAPTGVVSGTLGMGGPAAVGAMLGGPGVGVAAGLTSGALGTIGRVAATRMGQRNADLAELTARNGGRLPQAPWVDSETQKLLAAVAMAQQSRLSAPNNEERKKKRKP